MDKCVYCGTTEGKVIDHHTSYFPEALVKACRSCHKIEHDKQDKITEAEFELSLSSSTKRRAQHEQELNDEPLIIDDDLRQQINRLLTFA